MLKRAPITFTDERGYHVALPTYFMIAGTWLPLQPGLIHRNGPYPNAEPKDVLALNPTVIISAPVEDCLADDGQVCPIKIAAKYRGNDLYDSSDYKPPTLHDYHPIELEPPKESTIFERIAHRMGIGKK